VNVFLRTFSEKSQGSRGDNITDPGEDRSILLVKRYTYISTKNRLRHFLNGIFEWKINSAGAEENGINYINAMNENKPNVSQTQRNIQCKILA